MKRFERSEFSFTRENAINFSTATDSSGSAAPYRLTDNVGGTWANKPIYNQDQVFNQLFSGLKLDTSDSTVTYAFFDYKHTFGLANSPIKGGEGIGYSPMSDAEKAVARQGIELWDDLVSLNFDEVTPSTSGAKTWAQNTVDIWFANTTTGPAQAWAYYPGYGAEYTRASSDVWTADPSVNWTNQWLNYSGYGWTTIVHEIGHSVGLSHPGEYNFGDDNDGDGKPDPITYEGDAFYAQDSRQYSIMSYFSASKTGASTLDVAVGLANYPQTPMIDDIMAIQRIYGADTTTRTNDTVYGFNSNAGNPIYDFTKNTAPNLAIYDAGGNDTIDMSGANSGVFIDLRPGSFSSGAVRPTLASANAATEQFNAATDEVQGDFALWTQSSLDAYLTAVGNNRDKQIANYTGVTGVKALSFMNISIAYNTTIENAVGGSQRDYLYGNDVANRLTGNAGDDVLDGAKGNDIYNGGAGADEFRVSEIGGNEQIVDFVSGADKIRLSEIDANAALSGNQAFVMGGSSFTHTAGELIAYTSGGNNFLAGDVNGDGVADFTINLGTSTALTSDIYM